MGITDRYINRFYNISFFCLGIFPLLPFNIKPYALAPLVLVTIFSYVTKSHPIKSSKKVAVSASLFFVFLLSTFNSSDMSRSIELIWRISPLLFMPLSMALVPKESYTRYQKLFSHIFIYSCAIFCVMMFIYASTLKSTNLPLIYSFIRDKFWGYEDHPIYISLYIGIALILLLTKKENHLLSKGLFIVLISALVFLSRKGNIIGLLILLAGAIFWEQRKLLNKRNTQYLVVFILIAVGSAFLFENQTIDRFKELLFVNGFNLNDQTSTGIRGILWQTCIELTLQKPFFGYGLGEVQPAINNSLIEKGFESFTNTVSYGRFQYLNAHNQFLQMILTAGYTGGIIVLIILTQIFRYLFQLKNKEGLFIFMYISLCFLFESLLERQNGIIIVALFLNLYYFKEEKS
jgi:O-antigen ligase